MLDYSTRYYQLTPDILIEYNYATDNSIDSNIDVNGFEKVSIIKNSTPYMKMHLINNNFNGINLCESNFVVPIQKSQTTFVKPLHMVGVNKVFQAPNDNMIIDSFNYKTDNKVYSLSFDKIRFHFTSRNIMNGYDGLIFQLYVYDKQKNKICLMSFILSKTDKIEINENPMLLNQRIYTTYIDVKIPSIYKILKSYNPNYGFNTSNQNDALVFETLKNKLKINDGNVASIMTNTPIILNLYGVRYEYIQNTFTYYKTEQINTITIPCKDSLESIYIDISEATDGDYFIIKTNVTDNSSFSDYIYQLDEHPESFVILHELKLIEHYVTYDNKIKSQITHNEQFIINPTVKTIDEHDNEITTINQDALDEPLLFRPICKYGSRCFKFTIQDTVKIINTTDSTTIVKSGNYTYDNPSKYGKKMQRINLTDTPPVINVYNKRINTDIDMDNNVIKITNSGSAGPKIETSVQKTTSFIEGANIVVSVQQVSAMDVELLD